MDEEVKSSSFLRGESQVSKGREPSSLLRTIVAVLVIVNIIFVAMFAVTLYMVFDLKHEVKQLKFGERYHNSVTKPFVSPYTNGSDETPKKKVELKPNGRPTKSPKRIPELDRRQDQNEKTTTPKSVSGFFLV